MLDGVQWPLDNQWRTTYPPSRIVSALGPFVSEFACASLTDTDGMPLLNRLDTKYLFGASQLSQVLQSITEHYRVLDIEGVRLAPYQTLYFDTSDFSLYQQHHNSRASRYKVRMRRYVQTDTCFFEIKRKSNRGRTIKYRLSIPDGISSHHQQITDMIATHTPLTAQQFEPKLWNEFLRITLIGRHLPERITIDLNPEFGWHNRQGYLPNIIIAEVKQEQRMRTSVFIQQMQRLRIRPISFSKYCAGVWLLYQDARINHFKAKIQQINKLIRKEAGHVSLG